MLSQVPQPTAAAAIVRRDTSAAGRSSSDNARWKHPCGEETVTEPEESDDTTTDSNASIFDDLYQRVTALKVEIISLKNAYVSC